MLADVAQGMEFLHSTAHVIHGDLKPANVLLKGRDTPGSLTAVVADFGLSRMLDADASQRSVQRSQSLGTVQYMSPELLQAGRLTKAADVWAFGVMSASHCLHAPHCAGRWQSFHAGRWAA